MGKDNDLAEDIFYFSDVEEGWYTVQVTANLC
jgi:hypothetical protein